MIKCCKVPVIIAEDDVDLLKVKYKAMDVILSEAKFLANKALRFNIAFDLAVQKEKVFVPRTTEGEAVHTQTQIYRYLTQERKYIPSGCLSSLANNYVAKMYKANNKEAWKGTKSLPTVRSPILPIRHKGTTITKSGEGEEAQYLISPDGFKGGWLSADLCKEVGYTHEIPKEKRELIFKTVFSWRDGGSRAILERVVLGEYTVKDSSLIKIWKYDKATGKKKPRFFFLMVYELPVSNIVLDPAIVCGVDLGVVVPVYCALNNGLNRLPFGTAEEVWAARSKFRRQRRAKQREGGRQSVNVAWEQSEKEKNWVQNFYHTATRAIIKFCLRNNCGTIHMEDLSGLRKRDLGEGNERKRLMWVPSKLREMLSYKVKEYGINLVFVNPRNTSRRCSSCGYVDKDNRQSQAKFLCQHCGEEMNADYNAAKNIASMTGEEIENGYKKLEIAA